MNKQNVDSTKNLDEIEKSMNNGMSLKTEIIETIKEKEDELIINFISDNTNLCEEHKIPKDKIREVFEFYDTYRNKNLNITCRDYLDIMGLNKNIISDTQYGLNYPITRDFIEYVKILQKENKIKKERPKAKWIKTSLSYYDDDYGYECSNCKEIYCTDYDFEEMAYNYCPNCGARMNDEVGDGSKN